MPACKSHVPGDVDVEEVARTHVLLSSICEECGETIYASLPASRWKTESNDDEDEDNE